MIRETIKVISWRETHVIQTRNYDRLQKIIMVFLAAQCSKLKKKTRLNFLVPKINKNKKFHSFLIMNFELPFSACQSVITRIEEHAKDESKFGWNKYM